MFPRFVATGRRASLGLFLVMAAGLSAAPLAKTPSKARAVTTGVVTLRPSARVAAPLRNAGAFTKTPTLRPVRPECLLRNTIVQKQPVSAGVRPSAVAPSVVTLLPSAMPLVSKNTHGGDPDYDTNLTTAKTYDCIEPQYIPGSSSYVYSANPGGDAYPQASADGDPPIEGWPDFLKGVNDFHLYRNGRLVNVGVSGDTYGEQFEPNVANGVLAWSGFLPVTSSVYKPEIEDVTLDFHGPAVRTISYSADVLGGSSTTVHTLQPQPVGLIQIPADDGTTKNAAFFAPDATPAIYPANSRFIVFTSLRMRSGEKALPNYTRLYFWDTAADSDSQQVYPITLPGLENKSILNPRFSPDGQFLMFTVADIAFKPVLPSGMTGAGLPPDPVFDIDVTKKTLQTSFKSRVYLATFSMSGTGEDQTPRANVGLPTQVTQYKDRNGKEPRDLMPFMTALNQIGFSSDRLDTDGDGLPDGVAADPATAKFDIYLYPFPYSALTSGENYPDTTAHRQTLGHVMKKDNQGNDVIFDDSNELNGCAAPIDYDRPAAGLLKPVLLYQADDAGNWDIWETDPSGSRSPSGGDSFSGSVLRGLPVVTPNPSLTPDELTMVKKTHRTGMAGDWVSISAQVNPAYVARDQKGNQKPIYAIVKNPDNRIYEMAEQEVNTGIVVKVYTEKNCSPVAFTEDDYKAYDAYVTAHPELTDLQRGAVVVLYPDTTRPNPDPSGPPYLWYTGKWFTPVVSADYLLDIAVSRSDTSEKVINSTFVSDNIGGFSTRPFVPSSRILLVSDFAAGQRSVPETTGVIGTEGVPTESYFTQRPHPTMAHPLASTEMNSISCAPLGNQAWASLGPRTAWQKAPDKLTTDPVTGRVVAEGGSKLGDQGEPADPLNADDSPGQSDYDLWRVQCREPITLDDVKDSQGNVIQYGVLKEYLPYLVKQPGYPVPDKSLRTQRIADRCVYWFAPHAGNLNGNAGMNSTQVGTIANITTQNELLRFLGRGGRMLLTGDDVAFVLSQNNPQSSNPLLQAFKVAYRDDADTDTVTAYAYQRTDLTHAREEGAGANPIPYTSWEVHYNVAHQTPPTDPVLTPPFYTSPLGARDHNLRSDGAPTNWRIDSITGIGVGTTGGAEPVWNYTNADAGSNTLLAAATARVKSGGTGDQLLATNAPFSATFFAAFGMEGMHRQYIGTVDDGAGPYYVCLNPLGTALHNTLDFFCTGTIQGTVYLTNNLATPNNILVYATDDWNFENKGKIMGTATTDATGFYRIPGLVPSIYNFGAYKTGYAMQHQVRAPADTWFGGTMNVNITLVPVQPGTLNGYVTDQATGAGLNGVTVTAHDIQNTINLTAVTAAHVDASTGKSKDGWYEFNNVPAGVYVVTIDRQTVNGTNYAAYSNEAAPVTVATDSYPATGDTRGDTTLNITLVPQTTPPATATMTVTVYDASQTPAVLANGATVTVLDATTGKVVTTLDGQPNPATTGATGAVTFKLLTGAYKVQAQYSTYKTQSQVVTAKDENEGVTYVTFNFGSVLHVFGANKVLLASAPYDYSGSEASPLTFSNVLGLTDKQLANAVVAYNASSQQFTFYPTYPADTFRLGRGYGIKLPADGRITDQGTLAPTSSGSYVVRAETGWNLIGNPYTGSVVWSGSDANSVRVTLRDDANQTKMTIAEAMAKGYILSPLWGASSTDSDGNGVYAGYTQTNALVPWQAFWVKAAQPLLFYVPQATSVTAQSLATRVAAESAHRPLFPAADVWAMNITASAQNLTDDGLAVGMSRCATAGIDAGLDLAKPGLLDAPANYLYTAFVGGTNRFYATDVRGVGGTNVWTFTVSTNLNMRDVTLTWSSMGSLPKTGSLTLVDPATGQRVNMLATSRYTFRSARNGGTRTLRVEYRPAASR